MADSERDRKENDKGLIECIHALYRSIENKTNSPELQELFFRQIEKRDQLPDNTPEEIVQYFIECLVSISFADPDEQICLKAVNQLFRYLKADVQVFMNFRPTKVTIRKLKLDKYLLNSSQEVMETILDFSCFLLRYFENIDYDDFSDLSIINSKIRRAEIHRIWIDTEDILGRLEANETSIKQNLNKTASAFGEIFAYIDKIKREFHSFQDDISKKVDAVMAQMEQNKSLQQQTTAVLSETSRDKVKYEADLMAIMSRIDQVEKKITSTQPYDLAGQRGYYNNVNVDVDHNVLKQNLEYKIEEAKRELLSKISLVETELKASQNKKAQADAESFQNLVKSVNNLSATVEIIKKNDLSDELKVLTSRLAEFETQISNHENQLSSHERQLSIHESKHSSYANYDKQLENLAREIAFIKDQAKNYLKPTALDALGRDMDAIKRDLSFEIEKLGTFIQEFVNEQAKFKIKQIRQPDSTAKDIMENYEWFVRNVEFISPSIPQELLQWTKETLADTQNNPSKALLTTSKHESEVILNLLQLISECEETPNQALRQLLDSYLSFLEVLLMSDSNLEKALTTDIFERLFRIIMGDKSYNLEEKKDALRCISACLRKDKAILQVIKSKLYMNVMIELFKNPWDEEAIIILTNFVRIAFIFNEELTLSETSLLDISRQLFKNLRTYEYSEVLIEDTLLAIKNLTNKEQYLNSIEDPAWFDPILEIAKNKNKGRLRSLTTSILKNSSKKPIFASYFTKNGYTE